MGSGTDVMQQFRRALKRYEGFVRLKTGCKPFVFELGQEGEFTLVISDGRKTHRILFTRKKVLGHTASRPPMNQRMVKKTCDFVRDIVAKVK
jgi:hypothetical protein